MQRRARPTAPAFDAITIEGALIAPAMLAKIAASQADGQTDASYHVPKGLTLRDEIARYFRIGQAQFRDFAKLGSPSTAATTVFVETLLRDVFGFADFGLAASREHGGRTLAVTSRGLSGRAPIVVTKPVNDLDHAAPELAVEGRRRSPALALQDWLNASDEALWGLCCNGERLRLMRANASLTRPAYIEADLRQIFEADGFADFAALWLLVHASRFGAPGAPTTDCALERWRETASKEGVAARDRLRDGVEAALITLGNGFLNENPDLRERVVKGELALGDFFGQLLRLIYRLIFLAVAEERELLHAPVATPATRRLYAEGYSLAALRAQAIRRSAWDRHVDKWQGLQVVFLALARGEKRIGLLGLGGLFLPELTRDLDAAHLPNRALMEAVYRLAWLKDGSALVPVNWRDMETEELGSVYESLLELTPRIADDGRAFLFAEGGEAQGHARKTTGSYYTPDSLVQTLLDSALDPVLDRVEGELENPVDALLGLRVIDPACGSGHFLLAAARRIATRVARQRCGGVATAMDYRHALRDVARQCLYGVDRNPMAVELTKVALWIETIEPGKPLGFLDANIRCGDSLLGVFDLKALEQGIPDAAYKPLAGDDKETAKHFEKRNKSEREGQGALDFAAGAGRLPAAAPMAGEAKVLRAMPEDSSEEIAVKRKRFEAARADPRRWNLRIAADLYVAALLTPKFGGVPANRNTVTIPTTAHVWEALAGRMVYGPLVGRAQDLAAEARAFHWPLEFPDVMAAGGFDVVLGNPPWERIKLQEQEFFAARDPEIAQAPNAAARGRLIAKLNEAAPGTRERALYEEFEAAKRTAEASSVFARVPLEDGGRFPLTGRGDVNTYALFAELFASLAAPRGRAGVIVPTGVATDATTAPFFANLIANRQLTSLYDFQTGMGFFDSIGHARFKFALVTITGAGTGPVSPEFSFFSRTIDDFKDRRRFFTLSASDIERINPNTKTAPIFRTVSDAQLTTKIYSRLPVMVNEGKGEAGNPWGVHVRQGLFHLTNDISRGLVIDSVVTKIDTLVTSPVYEGKHIWAYDHRLASYPPNEADSHQIAVREKSNPETEARCRYFVSEETLNAVLRYHGWDRDWLIGWRDVSNATNERTIVASAIPRAGIAYTIRVVTGLGERGDRVALFLGSLNSLVLDFVARQIMGGTHLSDYITKQLPVIPPSCYTSSDLAFIVPRVLELTYTSHSIAPFARDLGYDGPPFTWDEDRRAQLRAELDALYARTYGLSRDELRYILDPADVKGPDYPSETFRVLKTNEIRRFGEYRTARLVLDAWDRMERGELT